MASYHDHHQLRVFFFPFLAHGHILPMANLVRLFAQRGVNSTIITTPANAALIRPVLDSRRSINLLLLPFPSTAETNLPAGCENTASLPHPHSLHILNLFKAIDLLHKPFADLLREHHPDFLISDWVYTWTTDLAHSLGIPRLIFQFCGSFPKVVCDLIHKHKPHLGNHDSISMPFQIPDVPHRIEMVKTELPVVFDHPFAFDRLQDAEMKSYGIVMNSFHELEPWYIKFVRGTRKLWCVGPVDLSDHNNNDNDDHNPITRWLDSKDPATVIYLCFGSECIFASEQIKDMAWGLEESDHPFVWVLRGKDIVLPDGFEERMKGKGLIVRGWAPQVRILNHPAVGGFVTHCGWNSIMEGVSAGLPMAAWPLHSEQFINEKLVVDVLRIGVRVLKAAGGVVDKETVRKSVESLVGGGEESLERSRRAKEYQAKARAAMEEGGSSYQDLSRLIEEMEENAKNRRTGRTKEIEGEE